MRKNTSEPKKPVENLQIHNEAVYKNASREDELWTIIAEINKSHEDLGLVSSTLHIIQAKTFLRAAISALKAELEEK